MNYRISSKTADAINTFYHNVAKKYKHAYSLELMLKNLTDAYDAIYQIENGLIRRRPTISRWNGLYMASYMVNGKTRWDYAYRIDGDTVYVEDACHAQSMSEFMPITVQTKHPFRKLTKKPLFGYSFVMNDRKEYNLIDKNGRLVTQWFRAIRPLQQPYGQRQIIAYINVGGFFCALGYDGQVYNLNRIWKEVYTEHRQILNTELFINIITESIENNMRTNKKVVRLSESKLHSIVENAIRKIVCEQYENDAEQDYQEFVRIFNGKTYDEVIDKVEQMGLSYGADNPDNFDGYCLNINYKSICATIYFYGQVGQDYETYDKDGSKPIQRTSTYQ